MPFSCWEGAAMFTLLLRAELGGNACSMQQAGSMAVHCLLL